MSEIANIGIERLERFQSLQAGQYWRAIVAIPEQGIEKDMVLLIQSIRDVDNSAHTVILRPHPEKIGWSGYIEGVDDQGQPYKHYVRYTEHRFLVNDFLNQFEYEPDHKAVRQQELQRIQQRTVELQQELITAQVDPLYLQPIIEEGMQKQASKTDAAEQVQNLPMLPEQHQGAIMASTGTMASVIESGISEFKIQEMRQAVEKEHQIATIKAQWIQGKTAEIAGTIKAMTPFFEEQAAAALAQTEDVRLYVDKLMRGIESLDLYVGKGVVVETLVKGESAAQSEPLTIMQRKLLMDEELAVWADVNERFDFQSDELFVKALNEHQALIDQIFPTQRCVLVMATTRRNIDYGDNWVNAAKNQQNKLVFLLIRDGGNIHRVYSPVESHLKAGKLFPSQTDQDKVFQKREFGFSGIDCSQVKFEDVAYTDKLAEHELFALHYKRFLILMCGLDHRLKLLGDFYDEPQSMSFVTKAFQEKYFRFISDDDSALNLPTESRLSFNDWIQEKNRYLKSGSRVLCKWEELMNPDTAPSASFDDSYNGRTSYYTRYKPSVGTSVKIAYKEGQHLCVDVEVKGENREYEERTFNCKVTLTKFKNSRYDYNEFPYLCLDAVTRDELHWYIHNRGQRRNHIHFIRFFKRALAFIEAELQLEADTRQRLMVALQEGGVAEGREAQAMVQQAVIAWRAAHRGNALPVFADGQNTKDWKSLLDQLYALSGKQSDLKTQVEQFVETLGYEPLRLVMTGKAQVVVYVAPKPEECDHRFETHHFVHRMVLDQGKKGLKEKSRKWMLLPKVSANETTLHVWPLEADWLFEKVMFQSFEQKQKLLSVLDEFQPLMEKMANPFEPEYFYDVLEAWRDMREVMMENSKNVENPYWVAPYGIGYSEHLKEFYFLCVGTHEMYAVLRDKAELDDDREAIREAFVSAYRDKKHAREKFAGETSFMLYHVMANNYLKVKNAFGLVDSVCSVPRHEHYSDHSLDAQQLNWEAKDKGVYWIPESYKKDGRAVLDALFDNTEPAELWVVRFYRITRRSDDTKYYSWYDITPMVTQVDDKIGDYELDEIDYFSSYELAMDYLEKRSKRYLWGSRDREIKITAACELEDAPQPTEGVERWYFEDIKVETEK